MLGFLRDRDLVWEQALGDTFSSLNPWAIFVLTVAGMSE